MEQENLQAQSNNTQGSKPNYKKQATAPKKPRAVAGAVEEVRKGDAVTLRKSFNKPQPNKKFNPNNHFGGKSKGLQVMFFGGVGKIGDNMTALRYGDDILVIDCGVGFAEADMPGVDLVIPDMTWLKKNKDKIQGICVTHAHEDHIGSMPYFLDDVTAPVYASKLTLAFIENKLREFPRVKLKGKPVNPGSVEKIGCFTVEFIHVNHSIPGAYAMAITTPVGVVFVTGDFKIDFTPIMGETTDLSRIGELGRKGVLLMLSESTNIERPGMAMSESVVGTALAKVFEQNKDRRIIVTSFASNIYRVQQIMNLAVKQGRKVAFAGRSMISNLEVAMKIGEIQFDHKNIVPLEKVGKMKDKDVMILGTGSQGQEHTTLDRMVKGEMGNLVISKNDTVIFSSSPVPGNEKSVTNLINMLMEKGAKVVYNELEDVHASGHACQTEFMMLHKLVKPRLFMPMHGEIKQLMYHEQFAQKMGIKPQNIIIPHVGSVIEVTQNGLRRLPDVQAGEKILDGKTICEPDNEIVKERIQMSQDGVCSVTLIVNKNSGKLVTAPQIEPRGFAYPAGLNDLIAEAQKVVTEALSSTGAEKIDWEEMKAIIRRVLTNTMAKKTKHKPLILTTIVEV